MKQELKRLKEIVHKHNEMVKIRNHIKPLLIQKLEPFLNREVTKQNTDLFKKVRDELNTEIEKQNYKIKPLTTEGNAKISYLYPTSDEYHISLKISICFSGGSYEERNQYCYYEEDYIYLGKIEKHKLIKTLESEPKPLINLEEEEKTFIEGYNNKKVYLQSVEKLKNYRIRELLRECYIKVID